ncbi:MAG: hypothetical protein OQK46_06055 [Gammaproteobacteria bacterium]|nr:hypothetical protein [Gammaproteobacteria bacterium]
MEVFNNKYSMTSLYKIVFLFPLLTIIGCSSSDSSSTTTTSNGAVETCFDVEVTNAGNSQTQNICTTLENGGYNGLGVARFIKFSVSSSNTSVSVRATRTSGLNPADPDIYLFKNGAIINYAESTQSNTEFLTVSNLGVGEYVVEINEYGYLSSSDKQILNTTLSQKTTGTLQDETTKGIEAVFQAPSSCNATGEFNVTGNVKFTRVPHSGTSLDYAASVNVPAQGVVVEVFCDDGIYNEDSLVVTNSDGDYTISFPSNQNAYIQVRAQMKSTNPLYDFSVVDNTSGQAPYVMQKGPYIAVDSTGASSFDTDFLAGSGWSIPSSEYTGARSAAPFAILDSIRLAKDKVAGAGATTFPTLKINWSENNTTASGDITLGQIGTSYFNGTEIYLLGAADNDTDEYDGHVIIHEWGHYFEHNFSRADSIGGPHSSSDILDMRVAFSEGFGNAFSGMVTGDPKYIDVSGDDQGIGFLINVENNSCSNPGWFSECSVQSILYDMEDSDADTNDTVDLTFTQIFNVLNGEQRTTPAFTSIFSFTKEIKDFTGVINGIDVLTSAQSIDPILDIYGDSETTNNPGATDQLPVHVAF